ncbi:TadE/TadG family type IV pilus assembly protein [Bradyrhizobium sp. JR3.5]
MKLAAIWRDNRATTALEFALTAPVFLLFIFGIIEFGLLLLDPARPATWHRIGSALRHRQFYAVSREQRHYQLCRPAGIRP